MPTKKLIEVALPLEAINKAAAAEKSIRHGHPSTLHLWWARRPLAACRAVLFASIVDDPSSHPDRFPTEELQERERKRLFAIIERMVPWANSNDPHVLKEVHDEIHKATNGDPLAVLDPFCGGGSIPLEAQRLGLEAHGSDLNPVAVLITKALIEIPPKFAGRPPVNPKDSANGLNGTWKGTSGLAADVRYYGQWMRDEAQKRIGHLYPKAKLPTGEEATVIAWIWARTVKCPNPACGAMMPLVRTWALSTKTGPNKAAWVEPKIERMAGEVPKVSFEVLTGAKVPGDKTGGTVTRQGATCVCCEAQVGFPHIRTEGKAGRMGAQMMAIVAEGTRTRVYLAPTKEQEEIAQDAKPEWKLESELPAKALGFRVQEYGMTHHADLFTSRQSGALSTFSDLVGKLTKKIEEECINSKSYSNFVMKSCGGGGGVNLYLKAGAV